MWNVLVKMIEEKNGKPYGSYPAVQLWARYQFIFTSISVFAILIKENSEMQFWA